MHVYGGSGVEDSVSRIEKAGRLPLARRIPFCPTIYEVSTIVAYSGPREGSTLGVLFWHTQLDRVVSVEVGEWLRRNPVVDCNSIGCIATHALGGLRRISAIGLLSLAAGNGQNAPQPGFEVASVRSAGGAFSTQPPNRSGGRISWTIQ